MYAFAPFVTEIEVKLLFRHIGMLKKEKLPLAKLISQKLETKKRKTRH